VSDQLNGTAVQAVIALTREASKVQEITKGGYNFTDRALVRVNVDPQLPWALHFYTLGAFAAYLVAERLESDVDTPFVHVVSPTEVQAVSPLMGADRHLRRVTAEARCAPAMHNFCFNEEFSLEQLAIALQTGFVPGGDVDELRQFCAGVRATSETGVADDGISQTVNARSGIAAVLTTKVRNPWVLAPYRTFAEVEQPASPFVLRFSGSDGDGLPQAALYTTVDGQWQVEAVRNVTAKLRELLGPEWQVLG